MITKFSLFVVSPTLHVVTIVLQSEYDKGETYEQAIGNIHNLYQNIKKVLITEDLN